MWLHTKPSVWGHNRLNLLILFTQFNLEIILVWGRRKLLKASAANHQADMQHDLQYQLLCVLFYYLIGAILTRLRWKAEQKKSLHVNMRIQQTQMREYSQTFHYTCTQCKHISAHTHRHTPATCSCLILPLPVLQCRLRHRYNPWLNMSVENKIHKIKMKNLHVRLCC